MHLFDQQISGIHLIWWVIWLVLLVWIFFFPNKKNRKRDPLEILKNRYMKNQITKEEYEESKKILESDN